MAIDFNADLASIFNPTEIAVTATFQPMTSGVPVGSSSSVNGIFDNDYFEITDGNGVVESSQPAFTCRTIDVAGVKHGDSITINGNQYLVVGNKPNAFGSTVLPLEAQ